MPEEAQGILITLAEREARGCVAVVAFHLNGNENEDEREKAEKSEGEEDEGEAAHFNFRFTIDDLRLASEQVYSGYDVFMVNSREISCVHFDNFPANIKRQRRIGLERTSVFIERLQINVTWMTRMIESAIMKSLMEYFCGRGANNLKGFGPVLLLERPESLRRQIRVKGVIQNQGMASRQKFFREMEH